MGVPKNGWFIRENAMKMDDLAGLSYIYVKFGSLFQILQILQSPDKSPCQSSQPVWAKAARAIPLFGKSINIHFDSKKTSLLAKLEDPILSGQGPIVFPYFLPVTRSPTNGGFLK